MTPVGSMRLLVVSAAPPEISLFHAVPLKMAPSPRDRDCQNKRRRCKW